MRLAPLLLFCGLALPARAQTPADDELFGTTEAPRKQAGLIIGVNGAQDFPGADMADRYGPSFRVGPSLLYKTASNWIFGVRGEFLFGGQVREDSVLINIRDADGTFLDDAGQRTGATVAERGYLVGFQAGRVFPLFARPASGKGLLLSISAGFIQHKVTLYNRQASIAQIREEYRKGYDRLANGTYAELFAGYNHFSASGLVNFYAGAGLLAARTAGRRDWLYDVRRPDDPSRTDVLFGIRAGWYFPAFKRASEEEYYQ